MLNRYGVQYNREESEKVDSLRYSVQKLFSQSVSKISTVSKTVEEFFNQIKNCVVFYFIFLEIFSEESTKPSRKKKKN